MDRANVHGTGVYVTRGVRQLQGVKWKRQMTTQPGGFGPNIYGRVGSTPAIVDGIVYVAGVEDCLLALDAETGQEKWRFQTPKGSMNSPAVADGVVYISSGDESLYAVDARTGKEIWRFSLPKLKVGNPLWSSSWFSNPAVVGGIVYVGNQRNLIFALDGKTGQVKWYREVSASVDYMPIVADGVVYFGTAIGSNIQKTSKFFYALDAQTGQELWRFPLEEGEEGVAGPPAIADGIVYFAARSQGLYALDARTGRKTWQFNKPGSLLVTSPAVAYKTVYVTMNRSLYALDSMSGREKWNFQRDEGFLIDPVIAEGVVYGLTYLSPASIGQQARGYLYAVDTQMGQEQWRLLASGLIGDTPAVADGVIYFKGEDGYLYAIH